MSRHKYSARNFWRRAARAAAANPRERESERHAAAAGGLCRDDGRGCCAVCGVSLDECEACGGVGYHRTGCEEAE